MDAATFAQSVDNTLLAQQGLLKRFIRVRLFCFIELVMVWESWRLQVRLARYRKFPSPPSAQFRSTGPASRIAGSRCHTFISARGSPAAGAFGLPPTCATTSASFGVGVANHSMALPLWTTGACERVGSLDPHCRSPCTFIKPVQARQVGSTKS